MRIGVLLYLVLRLVVGSFMLVHALYSIVMFNAYTLRIETYLNNAKLLDNSFFSLAAPLFPFVEFFLGSCVVLGLYYKKSLKLSLFALIGAGLFLVIAQPLGWKTFIAMVLVLSSTILLIKADKYRSSKIFNKQLFREKSLQQ